MAETISATGAVHAPRAGRFVAIDGLRGAAAIAVTCYHYLPLALGLHRPWSSTYVAVDLFFMLSGVVIAHSYESKLLAGMSVRAFTWQRLVRLYPLALLGMIVSSSALLAAAIMNDVDHVRWMSLVRDSLKGFIFLPRLRGDDFAFPINPPMWSLFCEVAVNIVYAAGIALLTNRRLVLICVIAAVGVVATGILHGNLDLGVTTHTIRGGAARTIWGFGVGILLYRLWRLGYLDRLPSWPPAVLIAAFLICCLPPYQSSWSATASSVAVVGVFPLLVALAMRSSPGGRVARICILLGEMSYPMYALHWGLLNWVRVAVPPGDILIAVGVTFASIPILAHVANRYWDVPVRAALRGTGRRRATNPERREIDRRLARTRDRTPVS